MEKPAVAQLDSYDAAIIECTVRDSELMKYFVPGISLLQHTTERRQQYATYT